MSAADKNRIVKGIKSAQALIKDGKYQETQKELNSISPIVSRTQFCQYEFCLISAALNEKMGNINEAISNAENALMLKPNEVNPIKVLIRNYMLANNLNKWAEIVETALKNITLDENLCKEIAPHLKEIDKDHHEVVQSFLEYLKKIPNFEKFINIEQIPENDDNIDFRISLLEKNLDNLDNCNSLLEIYLTEIEFENRDPKKLFDIAAKLPEDNKFRLQTEVQYGPDPVKMAKIYTEKYGNEKYGNFVLAVEVCNINDIKQQISYIPGFPSGWLYYAKIAVNPREKLIAYSNASKSYPKNISILKELADTQGSLKLIDDAISTYKKIIEIDSSQMCTFLDFVIKNNALDRAEKYFKDTEMSESQRGYISYYKYSNSKIKDKNLIKPLLKLEISQENALIKASVAYELRDDFDDPAQCQDIISACLKADKNNHNIYTIFAKFLRSQNENDKANFLFEKAISLGSHDSDACDYVSRKLISENNLSEALEICSRAKDSDWFQFRAGLISQRLGKHETACMYFQSEINDHPNNYQALSALAHSYFILNRILSSFSISEELKNLNVPNEEIESQISYFLEKPISINSDFQIEKTPMIFFSFLNQMILNINRFMKFGRKESSLALIINVDRLINELQIPGKWSNLGAVLRVCGLFYSTAFKITGDIEYNKKAFVFLKKRVEIDIRPESFIELSENLLSSGQLDQAISILRKVVHKFPESAPLWINLGVLFSMKGNMPFARHCLCVAAFISTNIESSEIFCIFAEISKLLNETESMERSIEEARLRNPKNPDVWQLLAENTKDISMIDAARVYFENGENPTTMQIFTKILSQIYLKKGMPLQALGFSMISCDDETTSLAYEECGYYNTALSLAKNDKSKQRLKVLLHQNVDSFPISQLLNEKNYNDAYELLKKEVESTEDTSSLLSLKIGMAICLIFLKKNEEAVNLLNEIKDNSPNLPNQIILGINKLILIYSPASVQIDYSKFSVKDIQTTFLINLRNANGEKFAAALKTVQDNENNPEALTYFLIEAIKSNQENSEDNLILDRARSLNYLKPSRDSLTLLLTAFMRSQQYQNAYNLIQKLMILNPHMISKYRSILEKLKTCIK